MWLICVVTIRYFVLELCVGTLFQVFLPDDHPKKYKGPRLPYHYEILCQLASGLEYIHSIPLIHRDIKPENILISVDSTVAKGRSQVTMKWADFGLSRPVNERGTYAMSKLEGTKDWLAPEILKQIEDERRKSWGSPNHWNGDTMETQLRGTVMSDIFAEGCVFAYLLANGKHPYYVSTEFDITSNIRTNKCAIGKL